MALRVPLIQVLLEHGKFNARNTQFTAGILFCYCFGVVGLSLQRLLARGFYAMGETRTPVLAGVAAMAYFCLSSYFLVRVTQGTAVASRMQLRPFGLERRSVAIVLWRCGWVFHSAAWAAGILAKRQRRFVKA